MPAINAFIKRHPMLTYVALTFAISWGAVLIVVLPAGFPAPTGQTDALFPLVFLAMLAGPSIAGILLTGLVHGREGYRELLVRLRKWRVGARWYAVALLTAPLMMTAVLLALSLTSPIFLPGIFTSDGKALLLLFGIIVGLGAGFFEELGWTGFAVPGLRLRHRIVGTGLLVGSLWGGWHFLVNLWASGGTAGTLSMPVFLSGVLFSLLFGALPAYRVLMVWVYDRTGSLLVAMLMHVSLTASTLMLGPVGISGVPFLTYDLTLGAVLWVLVAIVAAAGGGEVSRQPILSRAA